MKKKIYVADETRVVAEVMIDDEKLSETGEKYFDKTNLFTLKGRFRGITTDKLGNKVFHSSERGVKHEVIIPHISAELV